jgi:3-hydroxyacyl-[acyl-carrier-protein] dehydratase
VRFVLIDRFVAIEPGKRAVALKKFGRDEDVLADHFPGLPVVPGTLLTEAMGQTAGWLLAATVRFSRWPLLTMVERAKFRRLVSPEQEITLEAELEPLRGDDYVARTTARVEGERVAEARLVFHGFALDLGDRRGGFDLWCRQTFASLGGEALLAEAAGA